MSGKKLTGYELSRAWFDWCFENPEKISPNHTALYFFIIEHCNRLGWKKKFGLPTLHSMEAIGIKSKNTYYKTFNNLVEWEFIEVIEKSKNQNSANIISIHAASKFKSARKSALDIATIQHEDSTCVGGGNINKPITNNQEREEKNTLSPEINELIKTKTERDLKEVFQEIDKNDRWKEDMCRVHKIQGSTLEIKLINFQKLLNEFYEHLSVDLQVKEKSISDTYYHFSNWLKRKIAYEQQEV